MMELIDFLRARLNEDEQTARGVTVPLDWHQGPGDDDPEWVGDEMVLMWPPEFHTPYEQDKHWRGLTVEPAGLAAHIARHDPSRVLREVEAKRQLLEAHERHGEMQAWAVKLLALPYADHPDFNPDWRL